MTRPNLRIQILYVWITCWMSLVDEIIGIITLGYVHPTFGIDYSVWCSKHEIKRRKNKQDKS